MSDCEETKYFFACIEFREPQYSYGGVHCTIDRYEKVKNK